MMVNKVVLVVGGASVLSLAVGATGGYIFAQKKFEQQYREEAEKEIAEARHLFRALHTKNGYATPSAAVEDLGLDGEEVPMFHEAVTALLSYKGSMPVPSQAEPEEEPYVIPEQVNRNIFEEEGAQEMPENAEELWAKELAARLEDFPYLISSTEFYENEYGWRQISLTYYAGDRVLADDRDEHIPDIGRTVGQNNLARFGHWSGDARLVFVRNHPLQTEFEIALSDGKYSVEVMGEDDTPVQNNVRTRVTNNSPRDRFNQPNPGGVVQAGGH